jgi:hypothetical protein
VKEKKKITGAQFARKERKEKLKSAWAQLGNIKRK